MEEESSGPDRNRTCISSSGDLRTIHCTTGPESFLLEKITCIAAKNLYGNGEQNYTKKFTHCH